MKTYILSIVLCLGLLPQAFCQISFEQRYPANLNEARFDDFLAGDIDGDGDADLICSEYDENSDFTYAIYVNNGVGEFSKSNASYALPRTGRFVLLDDFNGDGVEDLFQVLEATNPYSLTFLLHTGNGSGGFNVDSSSYAPQPDLQIYGINSFVTADLDNDGDLDILALLAEMITGKGLNYFVFLNDGTGKLERSSEDLEKTFLASGDNLTSQPGDFNSDGLLDIPVITDDSVKFHINLGGGQFQLSTFGVPANGVHRIVVFDMNNDGLDDILAYSGDNHTSPSLLYLNQGSWQFTEVINHLIPDASFYVDIQTADMNLDGYEDLVIYKSAGLPRYGMVCLSDGVDGFEFTAVSNYIPRSEGYTGRTVLFDCDRDGDTDIFLGCTRDANTFSPMVPEVYFNDLYATGISEEEQNQGNINVFPNPSNGVFTIKSELVQTESAKNYSVYDMRGTLVLEAPLGLGENRIDLSLSQSGLYVLQIGDDKTILKKH